MTLNEWLNKYYSPYKSPLTAQISAAQSEVDKLSKSYDFKSDPLYQLYSKQFGREGRYAAIDAYGDAAASLGGMENSYALAAAEQAKSYYDAKLTDKIPELWELAYESKLSKLNALKDDEQTAYKRWLDGLETGYKLWTEEYDRYLSNENLKLKKKS